MLESGNKDEIQNQKNTVLKRVVNFIWGDSPFPWLLDINKKLGLFDKMLNVTWFTLFTILGVALTFSSLHIRNYLIVTLPVLILILCCIIILFRKEFGKQRFAHLGITIVMAFLSPQWVDLPFYLKNDYRVVEGIPSKFKFYNTKSRDYWKVVVDDVKLTLPGEIKEEDFKRWFVIRYLPLSKFIIDYKISTDKETQTKLQTLN